MPRIRIIALRWARPVILLCAVATLTACGLSDDDVARIVDAKIEATLTALPTATPVELAPTATIVPALPTVTPAPTTTPPAAATPQPTTTPQPTATPQPTSTSQPAATPQPTSTPQPAATPQPTATPQAAAVDWSAVYQDAWPATFWISVSGSRGTGWLLEPGLIVTNQHVVGFNSVVTVRQAEGPSFTATVFATDSITDVALLRFSSTSVDSELVTPFVFRSDPQPLTASPLMALGYSGDLKVNADGTAGRAGANVGVRTGTIDVGTRSTPVDNLVVDIPLDPGDSGGPVLAPDRSIVGMTRAAALGTLGRELGFAFIISIDEIEKSLVALRLGSSRR